jgi:predicted transcriptional regulator
MTFGVDDARGEAEDPVPVSVHHVNRADHPGSAHLKCILTTSPWHRTLPTHSAAEIGEDRMAETKTIDPRLVTEIVESYVSHNSVAASDLPRLIAVVHRSLAELGESPEVPVTREPAVARNRSYGRGFVVCLHCGWRGQMLRRHLATAHGQSRAEYRARWGLKLTHPLIAAAYSERRSTISKQVGLGRRRQATAASPEAGPTAPAKPRGRPRPRRNSVN